MKAVILDADSLHPEDLSLDSLLQQPFDWDVHGATAPDEVVTRCKGSHLILSNKVMVSEAAMAAAPDLKVIGVLATGTNNVDHVAAKARNVKVVNAIAYGTSSVVQHTWALILALTTHLQEYDTRARRDWPDSPFFCTWGTPSAELAGKTLGIIGYGELGSGVASIGRAFNMDVVVADLRDQGPRAPDGTPRLALDEVLAQADVLSLHCPLTPETENLIGATELGRMKNTALLVNCARGGIVNESDLADALRKGVIAGAGIDVLGKEPPVRDHTLLAPDIPNLIVTPHVAWAAQESRQRLVDQLAGKIQMIFGNLE